MIKTSIQWATYTHNFWTGCEKVSAGCKFCYMHRILDGNGVDPAKVFRSNNFAKPLSVKQSQLIFTCSMSDFFIEQADNWREDAWKVIKESPQHTWLILTKRPERIIHCLPPDWGCGYDNVWLGVSVEDRKSLHRLESLAKVPAVLRFISAEPLLEEIEFPSQIINLPIESLYQWIILGGESGSTFGKHSFRKCSQDWIYNTFKPLKDRGMYVFVKQLGSHIIREMFPWKTGVEHGDETRLWDQRLVVQEIPPWKYGVAVRSCSREAATKRGMEYYSKCLKQIENDLSKDRKIIDARIAMREIKNLLLVLSEIEPRAIANAVMVSQIRKGGGRLTDPKQDLYRMPMNRTII